MEAAWYQFLHTAWKAKGVVGAIALWREDNPTERNKVRNGEIGIDSLTYKGGLLSEFTECHNEVKIED